MIMTRVAVATGLLLALAGVSLAAEQKSAATATPALSPKHIDVAGVVTKPDAEAALGETVKDPQPRNEDGADGYYSRCNYYALNDAKSLVLRVRQVNGGKLDAKKEFQMLSAGTGKLKPIDNLGDRAGVFTSGPQGGLSRVLMLYVAKGNSLVTVGFGGMDDENMAMEKAKALAKKILKQL
jgi:hypothetical protein